MDQAFPIPYFHYPSTCLPVSIPGAPDHQWLVDVSVYYNSEPASISCIAFQRYNCACNWWGGGLPVVYRYLLPVGVLPSLLCLASRSNNPPSPPFWELLPPTNRGCSYHFHGISLSIVVLAIPTPPNMRPVTNLCRAGYSYPLFPSSMPIAIELYRQLFYYCPR